MNGKIGITIRGLIPGEMGGKEIFDLVESAMKQVRNILEEKGVVVEDYKIKVTLD